jgi:hypothetical protein
MQPQTFEFDRLGAADLVVDATYRGGKRGNTGDDPISKLLRCGNQGGFRAVGESSATTYTLVCLYSSMADLEWPDSLDLQSGQFVYFGDNKTPGHQLHETPRGGNRLLSECFSAVHSSPPRRDAVPSFLVFTKGGGGRDVVFRGLAVPGAKGLSPTEDLVAVWKASKDQRFQNYKATFTILDEAVIPRAWIDDLHGGTSASDNCPRSWRRWVETGVYSPLQAPPSIHYRSKDEQAPPKHLVSLVEAVYGYFKDDPYEFEKCAAELARLMDKNIVSCDLTRRWMDGGRDAVGRYRIGPPSNAITVEFALEAKCYKTGSGVGVKETSRLISRLRYRQFDIFVPTSFVSLQAYKEIVEDGQPVLVISGGDIARILVEAGLKSTQEVLDWLSSRFPKSGG